MKAIGYGASVCELIEFIVRNWTEGAMLPMEDVDPPRFDSRHRIFGGHLEVDRQLSDGILPPRHGPVKDMYDGALKERLDIVYVAVDVLRGMVVAQNSVRDGVDDRAHLVPRVDLWYCKQ